MCCRLWSEAGIGCLGYSKRQVAKSPVVKCVWGIPSNVAAALGCRANCSGAASLEFRSVAWSRPETSTSDYHLRRTFIAAHIAGCNALLGSADDEPCGEAMHSEPPRPAMNAQKIKQS